MFPKIIEHRIPASPTVLSVITTDQSVHWNLRHVSFFFRVIYIFFLLPLLSLDVELYRCFPQSLGAARHGSNATINLGILPATIPRHTQCNF
jgi:hypothetical protein